MPRGKLEEKEGQTKWREQLRKVLWRKRQYFLEILQAAKAERWLIITHPAVKGESALVAGVIEGQRQTNQRRADDHKLLSRDRPNCISPGKRNLIQRGASVSPHRFQSPPIPPPSNPIASGLRAPRLTSPSSSLPALPNGCFLHSPGGQRAQKALPPPVELLQKHCYPQIPDDFDVAASPVRRAHQLPGHPSHPGRPDLHISGQQGGPFGG